MKTTLGNGPHFPTVGPVLARGGVPKLGFHDSWKGGITIKYHKYIYKYHKTYKTHVGKLLEDSHICLFDDILGMTQTITWGWFPWKCAPHPLDLGDPFFGQPHFYVRVHVQTTMLDMAVSSCLKTMIN